MIGRDRVTVGVEIDTGWDDPEGDLSAGATDS